MLTKHKLAPSYGDGTDLLAGSVIVDDGSFSIKSEPMDPTTCPQQRKRQRLDHLSQEEKVMRRKLKNRVAAQCARDRKKVVMDTLEDEVNTLKVMVKKLETNNQRIQNDNAELQRKNDELQAKLAEIQSQKCSCVTQIKSSGRPLEYAEEAGIDCDGLLDVDLSCFDDFGSEPAPDMLEEIRRFLEGENFTVPDGVEEKIPEVQCEPEVVGPKAEQLESSKDLVLLDHIYHKSAFPVAPPGDNFVPADLLVDGAVPGATCPTITIENEMAGLFYGRDEEMGVDDSVVIETETCEVSSTTLPCSPQRFPHVVLKAECDDDDDDDDVVILDETCGQQRLPLLSSINELPSAKAFHNQNTVVTSSTTFDVSALLNVPDSPDEDSDYESGGSTKSYPSSCSSDDDGYVSPTSSNSVDNLRKGYMSPCPPNSGEVLRESYMSCGLSSQDGALFELFPVLM